MAWQLPRVQTVTQYLSNFGTLSHDNSETQLPHIAMIVQVQKHDVILLAIV